jgi:serine/threonine-protein kinase 24/25/MST4
MSFGNSGSTTRLFRRVPSDDSSSGKLGTSPDLASTNENRNPLGPGAPAEPASKEAILGRRLYSKAIDPALAELHAQTATVQKREALAKLSDAFLLLDSVDPEGAYHLMRNLVSALSQDNKLNNAFLRTTAMSKASAEGAPRGTVVIRSSDSPAPSPTKLVLSEANPHLKSHRRRQGSLAPEDSLCKSPEKERDREHDEEKMAFEARFPGREAIPGMEHYKQLSDALYSRWVDGLRMRWGNVAGA